MAVTILSGVVDDNLILSNQKVIDMDNEIKLLETDVTPLATMLMQLNKRPAQSQKVEWLEDQLLPRLTTLAASAATADTTVSVAAGTGAYFRVRDTIRLATTGENVAVTAVSTDTLGVTRAIGSVAAATAASGIDVVRIGNAAAEGATIGTLKQVKRTANFNYCQIQRNPFGYTETMIATKTYGGDVLALEAKKKMIEHKRDIENTLFLGRRALDTGGTTPIGYCGGISDYISTNVTNIAGALTQTLMETFLRGAFRYGSRNKVFFASPLIVSALASYPLSKLAPPDNEAIKSWGVPGLQTYRGAGSGGTVTVCEKLDWSDFQNGLTQFSGWGFLVDMDHVTLRPLRDTTLKPNRQGPDEDSNKQEYLTEYSLQFELEQAHAVMKGVTGYS